MAHTVLRAAGALLLILVVTLLGAPAFAQDIVLGASVQLTGPDANIGRYYRDAYTLAIDKINEAGGVKVGGTSTSWCSSSTTTSPT